MMSPQKIEMIMVSMNDDMIIGLQMKKNIRMFKRLEISWFREVAANIV